MRNHFKSFLTVVGCFLSYGPLSHASFQDEHTPYSRNSPISQQGKVRSLNKEEKGKEKAVEEDAGQPLRGLQTPIESTPWDPRSDVQGVRLMPQRTTDNLKSSPSPQPIWILSVDGGGIRGIIPAQILSYIEENLNRVLKERLKLKIEQELGNTFTFPSDVPVPVPVKAYLPQVFDLMAGTSIGGIIVLGLNVCDEATGLPRYTVPTLVNLQKDHGKQIFPSPRTPSLFNTLLNLFGAKYNAKNLDTVLNQYFGDALLSNSFTRVLVPAYEMRGERIYQFATDQARRSPSDNFFLKDVARATSAAPTFFPAATIYNQAKQQHLFADGGIIVNNPAMAAWVYANNHFPGASKITLVSIGTGHCPQDNLSSIAEEGQLGWAPVIAPVILDGTSKFNDMLLKTVEQSSSTFKFIRIQPTLTEKRSEMDNVDEDNLQYLLEIANSAIKDNEVELLSVVEGLADAYERKDYRLFPEIWQEIETQFKQGPSKLNFAHQYLDVVKAWELGKALKPHKNLLTDLNLANNFLDDEGLMLIVKNLPHLNILNAQSTGIKSKGVKFIAQQCPELTELNLSYNQIGSDGLTYLLTSLTNLLKLNLTATGFDDTHIAPLTKNLSKLTSLQIGRNKDLTQAGTILKSLPALQEVVFSGNRQAKASIINGLEFSQSLISLDLSRLDLTDTDLTQIQSSLKGNTNLQHLNFDFNAISDEGLKELVKFLEQPNNLKGLNLQNNNIKDQGLRMLKQALSTNNTLTDLNLNRNPIENSNPIEEPELVAFLYGLSENQSLRTLTLNYYEPDAVLQKAVDYLRRVKPSLKLIWGKGGN